MSTFEAVKYIFETLGKFKDQHEQTNFCREIILSEIAYNLNLLNILVNKKDEVEKEIIAKVLKRLKTDASVRHFKPHICCFQQLIILLPYIGQ